MIRVLIVDDQTLVRSAFAILVDSAPDMQIVGEASNGAEAVEMAKAREPDVVLMDIRMPVMDGLEATRQILAPDTTPLAGDTRPHVLVLTTFDLDQYVYEALRAGAAGFLLKDALPAELLAGIRVVAAGDALLAPRATRLLVEEFTRRRGVQATAPYALTQLTERERDVLRLIAQGLSNAEICADLVVSAATVKTHVSHLLAKLGARDRAQLVVIAYTSGFVG